MLESDAMLRSLLDQRHSLLSFRIRPRCRLVFRSRIYLSSERLIKAPTNRTNKSESPKDLQRTGPINCAGHGEANQRFACPAPFSKIFSFPSDPNHLFIPHRLIPQRGAYRDRHGRWDGMRWTRQRRRARGMQGGLWAREHSAGAWTSGVASAFAKASVDVHTPLSSL